MCWSRSCLHGDTLAFIWNNTRTPTKSWRQDTAEIQYARRPECLTLFLLEKYHKGILRCQHELLVQGIYLSIWIGILHDANLTKNSKFPVISMLSGSKLCSWTTDLTCVNTWFRTDSSIRSLALCSWPASPLACTPIPGSSLLTSLLL